MISFLFGSTEGLGFYSKNKHIFGFQNNCKIIVIACTFIDLAIF